MAWKNQLKVSKWSKGKKRAGGRKKVARRRAQVSQNKKVDVRVKIKQDMPIIVSQSIQSGKGLYMWNAFSLVNPDYVNITQHVRHQLHAKLYDEYCIKSLSVKYIPSITQNTTSSATATVNPVLFSFIDYDGKSPVSTSFDIPTKLKEYDSCKTTSLYKSVTRTLRPSHVHWLDSNASYSATQEALRQHGLEALLGFYGENLPVNTGANTMIGHYQITWNMAYRGAKPSAFAVGPTGGITVYEAESYPPLMPVQVTIPFENDVDPADVIGE